MENKRSKGNLKATCPPPGDARRTLLDQGYGSPLSLQTCFRHLPEPRLFDSLWWLVLSWIKKKKKRLNDDINAPHYNEGGFCMDINVSSSVCVWLYGIKGVWRRENISFESHLKLPVHTGRWGDEALWRTLDGRTGDCPSSKSVLREAPPLSHRLRSLQEGKVSPVPATFSTERRVPTRSALLL